MPRTLVAAGGALLMTMAPSGVMSAGGGPVGQAPGCIAIGMPVVEGMPDNAGDVATGVRDLIASYLKGPSVKVVSLEARLPSQALEEAKQKGCEPLGER